MKSVTQYKNRKQQLKKMKNNGLFVITDCQQLKSMSNKGNKGLILLYSTLIDLRTCGMYAHKKIQELT